MATVIPTEVTRAAQALLQREQHEDISALFTKGREAAAEIDAAWDRGVKLFAGAVVIFMAGYIGRSTPWRIITIVAAVAMGFKGVCLDIFGGFEEHYPVDVYGLKRRTLIDRVNNATENRIEALWAAMQNGLHGKTTAFGKNGTHYSSLIEWAGIELRGEGKERYTALALVVLGMEGDVLAKELTALLPTAESQEDFKCLINLGADFQNYQDSVLAQVPEARRAEFSSWAGDE